MAVMSSQLSEGVAFEQKIQPVPSSDKMALDLDINGFPKRDEPIAASEPILTTSDHPAENIAIIAEVNGAGNLDVLSSNQSISAPEAPIESQATEISPSSAPNSSQLFDTNTSTSEAVLATSPDQVQNNDTLGVLASESAVEQAVSDSAATSTVPAAVEAPESDLRDMNSPLALTESAPLISQEQPEAMIEDESSSFAAGEPVQVSNSESLDSKIQNNSSPAAIPEQREAFANLNIENSASDLSSANLPPTQEDAKPPADELDQGAMQIDYESGDTGMESSAGHNDTNMTDAPTAKVAREREDDDEMEEPLAKRAKTDDSSSNHHPDESATSIANGDDASSEPHGTTITEYQAQELLKSLRNIASRGQGKAFKAPVVEMWPGLAISYQAVITNPMDLRTMQEKVAGRRYRNLGEVKDDARLLYENAVAFNGAVHVVTKGADDTRKMIEAKVNSLSTAPAPPVKKDKKKRPVPSAGAAARAPAPSSRRQSHSSQPHTAPTAPEASQTYAVAPGGVPQPRRGSVMNRPKREIVPPKNKDLPYSVRPKNKKFATELRFCEEILAELNKAKHAAFVGAFTKPVDPVALGIPSYFSVIKRPMDLSTIARKLKEGSYVNAADFDRDIRLMLSNSFKFNPPGNIVHTWGREVESLYDEHWSKKEQYMLQHVPTVASPPSAHDSEEDEEDEDDEAADGGEAGSTINAARDRLVEEQEKLIAMMGAVPRNESLISMQQQMVDIVKKSVGEAEANAKKKQVKKAKPSKPVKKPVPVKKQSGPVKKEKKSTRYMGTLEKETISNGLGSLPDNLTSQVLEWIQNDQGNLAADSDGQFELDIDVISTEVLWKIHDLIMDVAPEIKAGLIQALQEAGRESPQLARPAPKKKNKPMSKTEQDRKIEHLQGTLESFQKASSRSQEPVMPTVERPDPDTSGDDDSDSEEE